MTDANDTAPENATHAGDSIGATNTAQTPELDGSVDALVANLRAAKEQLAELLSGGEKTSSESGETAEKADRSAA